MKLFDELKEFMGGGDDYTEANIVQKVRDRFAKLNEQNAALQRENIEQAGALAMKQSKNTFRPDAKAASAMVFAATGKTEQ